MELKILSSFPYNSLILTVVNCSFNCRWTIVPITENGHQIKLDLIDEELRR